MVKSNAQILQNVLFVTDALVRCACVSRLTGSICTVMSIVGLFAVVQSGNSVAVT